ncbi:MAG TPA: DNA polymerase III subunit alpha [Solirubrobacteraceae bacterium]|jgi:error-prone DNA polymerase
MAGTPPYVELHCHSAYSFLDGVSLPEELAQRAGELGYGALALTDHNSVSGSMELAQVADGCGISAIHGAEIDMIVDGGGDGVGAGRGHGAGRPGGAARCIGTATGARYGAPIEDACRHVTLLVRDARGWRNLCRIITLAHRHTREGGGRRALAEPAVGIEAVMAHGEGLVCLTGCAAHGVRDEATARRLLDAFGPQGLRVELQRPYGRHDRARNRMLVALARRLGVGCVASGDVHAHARGRAELQDAFVALRHHTTLDASEPLRRGNHSHVLSAPQAMANRFADHPEAVRETLSLAEELRFDLKKDLGYSYPGAEDEGALGRLAELCRVRLEERYGPGAQPLREGQASRGVAGRGRARARAAAHEEARGRLEQELRVIERLGLAGFFLLHHEMLELAREVAVEVRGPDTVRALLAPGRGRGSSVSSIVCYLTGLSHIDPIANRLLLGRFLHAELSDLPDIDLDFPRDVREVLIPRVHERYGAEHAALVAAFPTFRARGAIRELGKVLGLPPGEIERVARGAENWRGGAEHDIATADVAAGHRSAAGARGEDRSVAGPSWGNCEGVAPARSERWRWLERLVDEAYGLPRHLSQHPGGMVVSTRPLIDCCPVAPAAMAGRQMVQWDKDSCADAGFLKIDLLGLGMLSAVERCVELIARARGERVDLSRIPFDDRETFTAIRAADTVGVFQIESRAQMQSLRRTRPESLEDLTVQVAIVRPGPIQGGAINPYIERRARLREDPGYAIPYEHPALEPVLEATLGTIIFQDQVMEVAEAFAGFSPSEADGLRRAMSRKRSHELLQGHREQFVTGGERHAGADRQTAERVWEMVSGFAGFGFPKAHSAAFGLLAYQSTWLRVHYGPEFLCALLNEQPMGFYAPDTLVHEAERRGIAVLGLDVNASEVECTVQALPAEALPSTARVIDGSREAEAGPCEGAALGVRLGLGYVKGVVAEEVRELVAERERGGRFCSLGELAARVGAGRTTLEQLAWSGACDPLVEVDARIAGGRRGEGACSHVDRRRALWQLGLATPGRTVGAGTGAGVQLALPLELPGAPALRPLSRWQGVIADYETSGVTVGEHAMAVLRTRLTAPELVSSTELARLPSGREVTVAGLVIARQRPGTAKGTMFLLFEDERGTINLIVGRAVYERHRQLARAEPLLLARGRLERSEEGVVNVIVRELEPLERHLPGGIEADEESAARARVHSLADRRPPSVAADEDEESAAEVGAGMRAAAPPVQSFAMGRRR